MQGRSRSVLRTTATQPTTHMATPPSALRNVIPWQTGSKGPMFAKHLLSHRVLRRCIGHLVRVLCNSPATGQVDEKDWEAQRLNTMEGSKDGPDGGWAMWQGCCHVGTLRHQQ